MANEFLDEFPDEFSRLQEAQKKFCDVVFLVLSADKAEALRFLYCRLKINPVGCAIIEHLVFLPAHELLTKHIVYKKDKIPEFIAHEILQIAAV